jgi:hypothetical protein
LSRERVRDFLSTFLQRKDACLLQVKRRKSGDFRYDCSPPLKKSWTTTKNTRNQELGFVCFVSF